MTQMRTIESVPFATDLAAALATPGTDAMRVAEDFFGLADLFKENTRLARALTDPARSLADKQSLAKEAFASHVTTATMTVVNLVVADHWRHPADVADTLEVLGILGVLNAAGAQGALEQVREELTAKALAALEQGGDAQEIMQDLARKLTNRLIHAPTKSLQQAARDGDDERLHILRNSLGLE